MTTWKIRIFAPTGDFGATLEVGEDGGTMGGKNGSGPMVGLEASDTKMRWTTKIEKPMPMKLSFDGDIAGDTITGTVKFGVFASGTFEGHRVAQPA
ncbi:MAG: hypothetical protein AAGF78_12275 [Pseudomonadota bacterium]